jgi:hypothetical protein
LGSKSSKFFPRLGPGRSRGCGPRANDVDSRTSDLAQRTSDLDTRTSHLDSRTSHLDSRTSDLDPRTIDLDSRTSDLDPRTSDLDPRTSDLDPRTIDLDPRTSDLDPRTIDLDSRTSDLDPRTSDLDSRTSDLDPRTIDLDPRTSDLDPRTSDLDPRTSDLDPRTIDLDPRTIDLARRAIDLARRAIDLARRTIDLAQRAIDFARQPIDLAQRAIDLSRRRIAFARPTIDPARRTIYEVAPGRNGCAIAKCMTGAPDDAPAYLALMGVQPWGQLHVELFAHLRKKGRSEQEAGELASDCIARVYDPARSPWDPERGGTLLSHLKWVARSVMDNAGKKRKRQKTALAGDDEPEPLPDSNRDAVARHAHDMMMAEQREKLLAILAGKPRALQVLVLTEEGVDTVDEQLERMPGATRAQVYEARRALYDAARELMDRVKDPEVRRAWGLRQHEVTHLTAAEGARDE